MSRQPASAGIEQLIRNEWALFHGLAETLGLNPEARQNALELDDAAWAAWQGFLAGAPLPDAAAVPAMLRQLATASFWLTEIAEARQLAA